MPGAPAESLVKVTLIWPMLSMTPSPPRSRVQISTQSRGLPTSHSLEIPTTVEVRTFIHFKTSLMKDIYPRPKPMPRPQPGSSDNSGGGGGSYPPSHDGHGSTHGGGRYRPSDHGSNYGGDGYPSYGNPQGNRIAKIVSPIVCGLLVTLAGATASYFQYNRRKNCCRANVNFQSQGSRERYLGGVCSFWTLLPKENHRRTKLQTFLSKGGLHLQEGSYETEAYSGSIFLRIWATSKSQNLPLASLCWWMGGTEQPPGRGEPWCT
ncbi:glycoprotein Xg isoform X3 [Balaenoptera musculus]|uniref:Glycoprotein Xg isoform X3 n=1 Tax=Balaenoptera musculus TaxID=9771 RepID=A0A8B8WKS7_BALMU|nr:glycoprotein Xg isoform X3 [Balaenoptera musculus]